MTDNVVPLASPLREFVGEVSDETLKARGIYSSLRGNRDRLQQKIADECATLMRMAPRVNSGAQHREPDWIELGENVEQLRLAVDAIAMALPVLQRVHKLRAALHDKAWPKGDA